MRKKRIWILLAAILLFPLVSMSAYAGCCVYADSCSSGLTDSDCSGTFHFLNTPCQSANDCDIGCCCKQGDASINGAVFTRKRCVGAGGIFNWMTDWVSSGLGAYTNICSVTCGATSATCSLDYYCSDGTTLLAECVNGIYIFQNIVCPQPGAAGIDTDNDGTPDDMDLCPRERALTEPDGTTETDCTNKATCCGDGIDNDCNEAVDCYDADCCSVQSCYSNPTCVVVTCGNGNLDTGEECDDHNRVSGDGCNNICKKEFCGDGIVQPGLGEQCDFGDNLPDQWPGCYPSGTNDDATTETIVEVECTLTGGLAPSVITSCNDGIDNDGDTCFDWPMDRDCTSESEDAESNNDPNNCARCGDNILDTPNTQGINEDCDGTAGGCGSIEDVPGTCTDECTCSYTCLGNANSADTFEVLPLRGEFSNKITWQMHPNCNIDDMYLYSCTSPAGMCYPDRLLVVNETTYGNQDELNAYYQHKDTPITPYTRYCYRLDAYYTTGVIAESDIQCMTTGYDKCMVYDVEFCENNKRYLCDDNNMPEEIEDCSALSTVDPNDFVCIGPFADGTTECLYQSKCNLCNGLFGLFAIKAEAVYKGPLLSGSEEGEATYPCEEIPTCYNDTTRTTINKYLSCVDTASCYDYTSAEACWENRCQLGECEWVSSVKAFKELGVGVCRPKEKGVQNCSMCGIFNSEAMNRFYGDCDVETCKLYGECYYSYGQCGPKQESSCWSYTTEDDCINSNVTLEMKNVSVDTQWDHVDITDSIMKVGKSNALKEKSNDYFGFGLCKWIQYTGPMTDVPDYICIKDADNNSVGDCSYGDEFKACQTDNTVPKTTFLLDGRPMTSDGRVLLPRKIDLDYYTGEDAQVYFCIARETIPESRCYPNETSMCGIEKTFNGPSGNYRLYYFAEDTSHNLEEVGYIPVTIKTNAPTITGTPSLITGSTGNDYGITLTSSEQATCSGNLLKGNGVPTNPNDVIRFEIDDEFKRDFYDLPDNRYFFEYECKDIAGNVAKGRVEFDVDTNRIHSPEPYGPQNGTKTTMQIITDGHAVCKYARYTGYMPGYESMTPFAEETGPGTNGQFTYKTISYLSANEYYDYAVKCKFDDGKIEGEENDRIRFAIDNKAPSLYPVTTFEAYDYDVSQIWGQDQQIRLQCKDDYFERVKRAYNMDFGCKELEYKLDVSEEYPETPAALDIDDITVDPVNIIGTGTHTIYYNTTDEGLIEDDGTLTITINNDPPRLTLELFPYPMGPGSKPITGPISYGNYIVKVTSTKSLNDINMSLAVNNIVMPWSYMYSEDFGKTHYFLLRILFPGEGGLPKGPGYDGTITATGLVRMPGSSCTLDKIDSASLLATKGLPIRIETADPEITIEPTLDNYETMGYPLKKKGDRYYTNESRLFISGKRTNINSDIVKEVWFYVLNGDDTTSDMASPQKIYDFDQGMNAELPPAEPLNTEPISVAMPYAQKGSYTMNVAENSNLVNEQGFAETKKRVIGRHIEILNKHRKSYGHYREFYTVDWVENLGAGVWKLTLKEPLEENLARGDRVNIYTKPFDHFRFGQYADLEAGRNDLFLRPRSVSEVMPLAEDVFTIFTDPNPPVVISQIPKNGTTNNVHTPISIVVKEGSAESLVDEASIKLKLNGQYIGGVIVENYTLGSYVYYEITYAPEEPLKDGTYLVEFEGNDYSGHKFAASLTGSPAWIFTVDTKVPSTPTLWIENGTFYKGIWYVNRSPGFDLEFSDNDIVNITSIYKDHPFNVLAQWNYVRDSSHNNLFICQFVPPLEPLIISASGQMFVRDEFQLIVEAYKTLGNKQKSPKGYYYLPPMVVDNLIPAIASVSAPRRVRVDGDFVINARIPNEFHDLNATLIPVPAISGATANVYNELSQLEQTGRTGSFYDFKWHTPYISGTGKPPEVNQTFTLRVSDYAGNYNETNISIVVDLKVPNLNSIHVSVIPTVEDWLGDLRTKYTTIIVNGTFEDDDIASIFIIPGDYIPTQQVYENVSQRADIFGKNFMVNMQINGTINKTILNKMNIFIVDEAGYQVFLPLSVIADLEPPKVVGQPQWG